MTEGATAKVQLRRVNLATREALARGVQMARQLPTGALLILLGSLFLSLSDGLAVWLAAPVQIGRRWLAQRHLLLGWMAGDPGFGREIALLTLLLLLAALGCFLFSAMSAHPAWLRRGVRWLTAPLLLWALWASMQTGVILWRGALSSATQTPPRYSSDEMYYNQYDARLVLAGENPYTGEAQHLRAAMVYFHIRGFTPIARGRFSDGRHVPTGKEMRAVAAAYQRSPQTPPPELDPRTLHSYPAGAFLVDIPSVWLGLPGVGLAQIALFIALAIALCWLAPPEWRLLMALLLLANPLFAHRVVNGDFDIWWLAALIAAWLLRERGWLAGALVGVACAVKQTAWFAAPFYLLAVAWTCGWRAALRQALTALVAFLVVNLPWALVSPRAWGESLLLPLSLPLLPEGSGFVALGIAGLGPLAPAHVYTALEGALLVGALTVAWRLRTRAPYLALLLPLLPLMAAWRSPERYFMALPLLAVAALLLTWRARGYPPPPHPKGAQGVGAGVRG